MFYLGVRMGLQGHYPLAAIIVNVGAMTLVLESPFLETLVPSRCLRDATVWVSYEVGLGEIAFLWLLVNLSDMNCWTGQASIDSISSILS